MFYIRKSNSFYFIFCITLLFSSFHFYYTGAMDNEYKGCLADKYNFKLVKNETQIQDLYLKLKLCKAFALDTETTGFDPLKNECVGISISIQEGESFYIPFAHNVESEQLTREQVVKYLKPIFENEKIEKYFHHAEFDILFLYAVGIDVKGPIFCSSLAARCIDLDEKHDLKSLSEAYLGETMISFKIAVLDNGHKDFSEVPLDLATKYAAADAHQTLKIVKVFQKKLQKKQLDQQVYKEILSREKVLYEDKKKAIQNNDRSKNFFPRETKKRLREDILSLRDEILNPRKRRKVVI